MDALAETEHGQKFVSALAKDNIFAVQFHPEKVNLKDCSCTKTF